MEVKKRGDKILSKGVNDYIKCNARDEEVP